MYIKKRLYKNLLQSTLNFCEAIVHSLLTQVQQQQEKTAKIVCVSFSYYYKFHRWAMKPKNASFFLR